MANVEDPITYNFGNLRDKTMYEGRTSRGMYDLDTIPDTRMDDQRKCLSKLSSLSLLKPQGIDVEVSSETMERPVTPINDSVLAPPKTFSILCKYIRRRINPRSHWDHISIEDQRSLGAIILGEVNAVWSIFRKQVDDPFLTQRQNRELQRRITVHIVTVCEQLFLYYCNQVKVLNARGVFSEAANMSRVRGQIALDADKYLNLLSVRRHIISDLKKVTEHDSIVATKKKHPVTPVPPKSPRYLSFRTLIETSRPKQNSRHDFNLKQEIKDMKKQMPSLDIGLAYSLLPPLAAPDGIIEDKIETEDEREEQELSHRSASPIRLLKKWSSEPLLATEGLLEIIKEREDAESPFTHSRLQSTPKNIPSANRVVHSARGVCSAPQSALAGRRVDMQESDMNDVDPKQDLAKLIQLQTTTQKEDFTTDDDISIPPLIQAITRREMQEMKMKQLKQDEKDLDERRKIFEEEESKPLPEPKYPQPPVIQVKIPGHANPIDRSSITIRSSDIHIPDKVDLPSVSLEMHGPLYNDLVGEISPATVKELDANLFQGEELKEVYHEIMKTVANHHLMFNNDPMVVTPSQSVDINKILASSTLVRPRSQRIINPELRKSGIQPPWAGEPQNVWERKNLLLPSTTTSVSGSHLFAFPPHLSHAPTVDKTSRAYASWLAWWKATINTDDYLKYLSTQETDFLGVVYHFYDSEATDSETNSTSKTAQLEAERKRDEKLAEIKAKKEHYIRGVWNVNAVMLGGLGKYPDLEEYSAKLHTDSDDTAESISGDKSVSTNLQTSPRSSKLPTIPSDESADSESSFKEEISPRRKSPRRRARSHLKDVYEVASDEDSNHESRTLEESLDNSSLSDSRESNVNASYLKSNNSEATMTLDGSNATNDTLLANPTDSIVPIPRGGSRLQIKHRTNVEDSGESSIETNSSIDAVRLAEASYKCGISQDEITSGYMSLEGKLVSNLQMQNRKKLLSRKRSSRPVRNEKVLAGNYKAEWRQSATNVKKPINLLKGYYKSGSQALSPGDKATTITPDNRATPLSLQARLEAVWRRLKLSSSQKLNAALKYSADQYLPILEEIVSALERVTNLIQKREKILHDLEMFEREASDPHRFFYKGSKGSSIVRLKEAKSRANLYQKLDSLEKSMSPMLHSIHRNYRDIVTFEGRAYHEKMSLDKIEMLYWLQQERRCQQLYDQGHPEQMKQFMRDNHMTKSAPITKQLPMPINNVTIDQQTS